MDDLESRLLPSSLQSPDAPPAIRVYAARWYICAIFVLFCVMQSSMWGFFSPIQGPLQQLYGWSDDYIVWLGNAANITFCILVIPLGALVDGPRGMRIPLLVTVVALCANSGLRCVPVNWVGQRGYDALQMVSMRACAPPPFWPRPSAPTPLTHTHPPPPAPVANGLAGTLESLAPPVLSALWFPVGERATATAIMATANTFGTAVGFSVAFVVPETGNNADINAALQRVYWGMFLVCVGTLSAMVFYFPNKPPTPPAPSCEVQRVAVLAGLGQLARHGRFWLVVFAMATPLGVYAAWLNVLDINLQNYAFSQNDAAWIGFGSTVAGAVGGIVSGRFADAFPGRLTRIIAALYGGATACVLLFSLICVGVLPFSLPAVYALTVGAGFLFYATYPLFFELVMETIFPIPEAIASGGLVCAQAVVQSLFLFIPPSLGTAWPNWTRVGCPVCAIAVLLLFKESYQRLHTDLGAAEAADAEQVKVRALALS